MGIAVLGPLQVDGQAGGLSPRDRVVLSALVVRVGEPTTTASLAEALWGEDLPPSWSKVVQGCVVRLRKRLGAGAIESGPLGYRLMVSDDELDARLFERLVRRGRALEEADPARASYLVTEALDLWRGRALADLDDWQPARTEVGRLEELRLDAEEIQVQAETETGHAQDVVDRARALVARAPYRERRWALLAKALYQTGRQEEALGALQQARGMLVDELGLDPGPELAELERRVLRQDPSLMPRPRRDVDPDCPYPGLLPYDEESSDCFFGRESDEAACLRRLRDTGVLAVVGSSGIGKSSLVRAGVVASLIRRGTRVRVTTPGRHPLVSLAGSPTTRRQTLVVDQAEEAVTMCGDPAERSRYFTSLATHVNSGGALVLALRADHLGDLAPYTEMARVLEDGLYLLGPMKEPDLRHAIEEPARRAGLRLEPGLVDLLVRDVEGEPAALPMLSHVLREIWQRREGPTLTVDGYRATGGIRDAVARSAEALYDGMDASQRIQLRHLLLRLVVPTEDGDPVRARVPHVKLAVDDDHAVLVEQLVDARLVSIDGDNVQIAHEALVEAWPRLRDWFDEDVEGQQLLRHLAAAADAWDGMGRPDSELYRGTRLGTVLEWRARAVPDLDETEVEFLDASAALSASELRAAETRIAEQRSINRRLRSALGGVGVLLVLALIAGFLAARSAEQARHQRHVAVVAAILANARHAGAQALTTDVASTSLLLGLAALQVDRSAPEWENLATTLTRLGALQHIRRTGGSAVSLAVSGNGATVAVSLQDKGVRLYDATTLAPATFADDTPTGAVAFSPDGRLMAAAVDPFDPGGPPRLGRPPVHLYDVRTAASSLRQLGGWPGGAMVGYAPLAFSDDGSRIVAGVNRYVATKQRPAAVMVWDLASPSEPVFTVRVPHAPDAALSPDGRVVYTATTGPRSVRAYDVDSHRLLRWAGSDLIGPSRKGAMDVSPDGSTVAVAAGSRILRFDTATLAREPDLVGHTADVVDLVYSHDGSMLLSTSADRSAVVWDTAAGRPIQRLAAHNDQIWGGDFSPDDHTVYTASGDETLMSWDVTGRGDFLARGAHRAPAGQVGVSLAAPDGHTVARTGDDRLWFLDTRTGRTTARSALPHRVSAHAWSPDSRWLLATGAGQLSVWDAGTGRLAGTREYPRGEIATFGDDSDTIYVDDRNGHLQTLDRRSLRVARTMEIGSRVRALIPDPVDGSVVALGKDGSVVRIDPRRGREIASSGPGLLATDVQVAAFSPDGSRLAAAHPDGSVRLLDANTFQWVGRASPADWEHNVVYAPDGSQFASVQTGRIRLWDGRTGAYEASIPLPDLPASGLYSTDSPGPGSTIAYLADSAGLLVTSADGRTWTVDPRTRTWTQRACDIAGRNLTRSEWERFFPIRRYRVVCPQWPAGT